MMRSIRSTPCQIIKPATFSKLLLLAHPTLPWCTRHGTSTIGTILVLINRELQFLEYIQLLILNAQVYNAGKKGHTKSKLDVNLNKLAFEEIETDETIVEVNEHDIDPTYGQLEVNVNDTKCSLLKSSAA
jgi:hypothetical protein